MFFRFVPRLAFCAVASLTGFVWPNIAVSSSLHLPESEEFSFQELLPSDNVITLTLQEAVMEALDHNLDIRVSRHTRDVRLTDIVFQQAQFDPTVELGGRYDRTVVPLNRPIFGLGGVTLGSIPDTFDQNETNFSLGLKQKLLTGGSYDLTFDTNRNSVAGSTSFLFNPAYSSNVLFNLTQPLLRNFGPTVNNIQITLAQNAADVEQLTLLNQILSVIAQVEQAYWELVFARENLKVARATLQAAEELLASNRAKVKAGVMADVEVLQAQAGVANQIEQILLAQKTVLDQEDQLRLLLSKSELKLTQTTPLVPLDPPIQHLQETPLQENLEVAFEHRPEILQAKMNIETSNVNTRFAKNQLLPDLSFQGSLGLSGLGRNPGDNWDRLGSTDFYNMGGGLVLSYPIGNRSAQSQYQRRILETQQSQASLLRIRQQIILDVKEAIRQVQTSFKRTRTNQTARQLSERQLKAEQERLNLGLSTTRFVLEFQRDLRIARSRELRAILDYNQSLSRLRLVTASTLDHYNIEIQ
ncbi:MAG: TolC family protein [Nitrospira sp.]|nr:TolC family protein [Nitrospira sp.]